MKKILLIVWDITIIGGISQVAITLANDLCKEHEVYIASLVKENDDFSYALDSKVHDVFYVMGYKCRGRNVLLKGKKKLVTFFDKNKIDIVFLMGFQASLPAIVMLGRKRGYKVYCDHEALMSRWHEKKITFVRYLSARFSDKIVTLTQKTALDFQRKFHLSEDKVEYIYNSISEKIWENRSNYYNSDSKIILSVGRFSPEKGYDMLVDIAENVLKGGNGWKWFIYGSGDTFNDIQEKIKNKGLENRLILKGIANDVASIYKEGAIFVLTSLREGLPLVLLEAKANHLPCVSFDIESGPSDIIRDKIDGILVTPYDKVAMTKEIERLINDKQLRIAMAERADENLKEFSKDKIMEKWEEIINFN